MSFVITIHREAASGLADIELQSTDDDLCTGLIRWRDGAELHDELNELERLINDQVLPLVDEAQARIDRMGVYLVWRGARVRIYDLQTHANSVSFRCDPAVVREIAQAVGQSAQSG